MKATIEEFADEFPRVGQSTSSQLPPAEEASDEVAAVDASIAPLAGSGLVIIKAALIAALQVYMPQLVDLAPIEGKCFLLSAEPTTTDRSQG
jgi:hypothetical protein